MQQSVQTMPAAAHHQKISPVEQVSIADEIRQRLLALHSSDPRIRQLKKDLQQGKNRAPETITAIIAAAFNEENPVAEVLSPTQTLGHFIMSRVRRVRRRFRELSPIETREEGEFEQLQNAIDLGDTSTPTKLAFIKEADEYIAVVQEMRDAMVDDVYGPKEVSV